MHLIDLELFENTYGEYNVDDGLVLTDSNLGFICIFQYTRPL